MEEKNLCTTCYRRMADIGSTCESCKIGRKRQHKSRIERGICTKCGSRPRAEEILLCEVCDNKVKEREHKKFIKNRDSNKCTCCGKAKDMEGVVCKACHERKRESRLKTNRDLKTEVFNRYGGLVCTCCGEEEFEFLQLDHVNNDGAAKRREIGKGAGANYWKWLKENNYPEGYQVLCTNCNWGKRVNDGVCPHETKRKSGWMETFSTQDMMY